MYHLTVHQTNVLTQIDKAADESYGIFPLDSLLSSYSPDNEAGTQHAITLFSSEESAKSYVDSDIT